MKALSVRQPWAGLIVAGVKGIEYRSWSTRHRGAILIHASRAADSMPSCPPEVKAPVEPRLLAARGLILGQVNLVDCRPATPADRSAALCEVTEEGFAWVLEDPRAFAEFIPAKGNLRLFEVAFPRNSLAPPGGAG